MNKMILLSQLEHSAKAYWKNLSEYFTLLNEFCKMGDQESQFLLSINTIYAMANFYLGQKPTDLVMMDLSRMGNVVTNFVIGLMKPCFVRRWK